MNKDGLPGVVAQLTQWLRERRPALMVIDSFKALRAYAADDGTFRRFLHEAAGRLSAMPITSFWVGEYAGAETAEAPEFAVADTIVSLSADPLVKARPSAPGIETSPAAARSRAGTLIVSHPTASRVSLASRTQWKLTGTNRHSTERARVSSFSTKCCPMAFGGARRHLLPARPVQERRSLLCTSAFAVRSSASGASLPPSRKTPCSWNECSVGSLGPLKEQGIELMYRSPVDLYLDEWVYDLLGTIERSGATRVVIDSLGDLRAACGR